MYYMQSVNLLAFESAAFRSQLSQVNSSIGVLGGLFWLSFCVPFSCCFFVRFGVVLGCLWGSFLVSKIDQNENL